MMVLSGRRAPLGSARTAPLLARPFPGLLVRVPLSAAAAAARAHRPAARRSKYSPEVAELLRWLRAGGGSCLGVQDVPDPIWGRTLVASKDISAGDTIVQVPSRRMIISRDPVDRDILLAGYPKAVREAFIDVPCETAVTELALQLAAERAKGSASKVHPYIASLVVDVSNMPSTWPEADIQALQHLETIAELKRRCQWVQELPKVMADHGLEFDGARITAELLGWGLATAASRAFLPASIWESSSLEPVIDMCTHSPQPNCMVEWADSLKAGKPFWGRWLVAKRDIAKGEVLTLDYGPRAHLSEDPGPLTNTLLLLDFGTVTPRNPQGALTFSTSVAALQQAACALSGEPVPPKLEEWQDSVLSTLHIGFAERWWTVTCSITWSLGLATSVIDPCMVAAARILCSNSEADLQGRSGRELGDLSRPLAKEIEVKVLHILAAQCEAQLKGMTGTSMEDDRSLLESPHSLLTHNEQLAVRYRLQVKEAVAEAQREVFGRLRALQ